MLYCPICKNILKTDFIHTYYNYAGSKFKCYTTNRCYFSIFFDTDIIKNESEKHTIHNNLDAVFMKKKDIKII